MHWFENQLWLLTAARSVPSPSFVFYTVTCFTKWWPSPYPCLWTNEPYQSWYYHLVPMNLFTCEIFQTGVFWSLQQLSQSFVAPVPIFVHLIPNKHIFAPASDVAEGKQELCSLCNAFNWVFVEKGLAIDLILFYPRFMERSLELCMWVLTVAAQSFCRQTRCFQLSNGALRRAAKQWLLETCQLQCENKFSQQTWQSVLKKLSKLL